MCMCGAGLARDVSAAVIEEMTVVRCTVEGSQCAAPGLLHRCFELAKKADDDFDRLVAFVERINKVKGPQWVQLEGSAQDNGAQA